MQHHEYIRCLDLPREIGFTLVVHIPHTTRPLQQSNSLPPFVRLVCRSCLDFTAVARNERLARCMNFTFTRENKNPCWSQAGVVQKRQTAHKDALMRGKNSFCSVFVRVCDQRLRQCRRARVRNINSWGNKQAVKKHGGSLIGGRQRLQ